MNQVSGKILKQNLMILRSKFSLTLSGGHLLLPLRVWIWVPRDLGNWIFWALWNWAIFITQVCPESQGVWRVWLPGTLGWAIAEHRLPCISSQTQVPGAPVVVDSNPELTPTLQVGMGFQVAIAIKEPACKCRKFKRSRFHPWVREIPWRRAWQPTPTFLPGESHGAWQAAVHKVTQSQTRLK